MAILGSGAEAGTGSQSGRFLTKFLMSEMGCAMTSLKTAAMSMLFSLVASLGVQAATLQTYTIHAQGAFSALHYSGLYSYDHATYAFQSHQSITFTDPSSVSLAGHHLSGAMRTTSGSARMQFSPDGDLVAGNASITGCTGFLTFLCTGGTQVFDLATQRLSSFTVNASLATLSASDLVYQSDAVVDWTAGTTSFFNSGGLQTMDFKISSLEINLAPVPLPGGFALLFGGAMLLAGLKARAALN